VPALIAAMAGSASATRPMIIQGEATLQGEHMASEIVITQGARLRVRPMDASGGLGWLRLRAGRIVVETAGSIDANGAGYQGADASDGAAPPGTNGGGQFPGTIGRPGTGGANGGNGSNGSSETCTGFTLTGGVAYADPAMLLPGAAGGAAHQADMTFPSRGGHGGGQIELEAARIEIHGEVTARGGDGISVKGLGSGAGGGGAIRITTAALTGSGIIRAVGGVGGAGIVNGGGGGGGIVVIFTPDGTAGGLASDQSVAAGASGTCNGAAGAGVLSLQMGPACLDVDGDGHQAQSCGGDDCDDGDAAIHPDGLDDTCDGQDNDCSGAADESLPPGACPDLHVCQAGACAPIPDAGPGADAGASGPPPDHLEYQGGCSLGDAGQGRSASLGAAEAVSGASRGAAEAVSGAAWIALGLLVRRARRTRVVARRKVP
jgi:hypothetical protein